MSRNCWSGQAMNWLLLFLLLLRDLSSANDNTYVQNSTNVCTGRQALFRWKYDVKPFFGVTWTHNGTKIASSLSLSFSPEVIISEQFKGRLNFISEANFSFTLDAATQEDNGMFRCVFTFDNGSKSTVMGPLIVKDLVVDNLLVEKVKEEEEADTCVTLSCNADPSCTWTYPNGTTEVAKKIRHCSEKETETIKCESDHVCKHANYTRSCNDSNANRRRRSSDDNFCQKDDSDSDGALPGTDSINPIPIVLCVLAAIIAIIVIIVFYKRRSKKQGEKGPPVHYITTPVEDNQNM